MTMKQLFNAVEGMVGSDAIFRGISFEVNGGMLSVDYYGEAANLYRVVFLPFGESEAIEFTAVGIDELREELFDRFII